MPAKCDESPKRDDFVSSLRNATFSVRTRAIIRSNNNNDRGVFDKCNDRIIKFFAESEIKSIVRGFRETRANNVRPLNPDTPQGRRSALWDSCPPRNNFGPTRKKKTSEYCMEISVSKAKRRPVHQISLKTRCVLFAIKK